MFGHSIVSGETAVSPWLSGSKNPGTRWRQINWTGIFATRFGRIRKALLRRLPTGWRRRDVGRCC